MSRSGQVGCVARLCVKSCSVLLLEFGDKPEATAAIRTMSTIVTKPFCQLSALTFIGNSRTENLLQTVRRPAQQTCSQVQNLHTFFRLSESPDGEKPTHWRTVSYREDKGRVSPTSHQGLNTGHAVRAGLHAPRHFILSAWPSGTRLESRFQCSLLRVVAAGI